MSSISWAYNLSKEELDVQLESFEVDSSSAIQELRQQLVSFINEADHDAETQERITELEELHRINKSLNPPKDNAEIRVGHGNTAYSDGLSLLLPTLGSTKCSDCPSCPKSTATTAAYAVDFNAMPRSMSRKRKHENYYNLPKLRLKRTHRQGLPEPTHTVLFGMQSTSDPHHPAAGQPRRSCSDMLTDHLPVHQSNNDLFRDEGNRIRAFVVVGTLHTMATIDTGASASFISQSLTRQLGKDSVNVAVEIDVTLADGSTHALEEVVNTHVKLGNFEAKITFIVMPNITDNIVLGIDFLRAAGASLSCGGVSLFLQDQGSNKKFRNCHVTTKVEAATDTTTDKFLPQELQKFKDIHRRDTIRAEEQDAAINMLDSLKPPLHYATLVQKCRQYLGLEYEVRKVVNANRQCLRPEVMPCHVLQVIIARLEASVWNGPQITDHQRHKLARLLRVLYQNACGQSLSKIHEVANSNSCKAGEQLDKNDISSNDSKSNSNDFSSTRSRNDEVIGREIVVPQLKQVTTASHQQVTTSN